MKSLLHIVIMDEVVSKRTTLCELVNQKYELPVATMSGDSIEDAPNIILVKFGFNWQTGFRGETRITVAVE